MVAARFWAFVTSWRAWSAERVAGAERRNSMTGMRDEMLKAEFQIRLGTSGSAALRFATLQTNFKKAEAH